MQRFTQGVYAAPRTCAFEQPIFYTTSHCTQWTHKTDKEHYIKNTQLSTNRFIEAKRR
jgi:hypothetical protein